MGYNAAKKAQPIVSHLQTILAIELMSAYQAQPFIASELNRSPATQAVLELVSQQVPYLDEDAFYQPHLLHLTKLIATGQLLATAQAVVGELA